MKPSENAPKLKEAIEKAISDGKVTPLEYDHIINLAHEDGKIDKQEQALLQTFHQMLNDGTLKRVPAEI